MPDRKSTGIRRASPDQAGSLTQIAFAAKRYWGYPEDWIQIWSPLLTITPEYIDRNETYIAWQEEQPVGFCSISQAGERANLEHLWVLPKFIGRGIGSTLFKHIIFKCKDLGVHVIEIESDPNAQGFYERMGAKKVGEVVGEVDGQPRVLPLLEVKI